MIRRTSKILAAAVVAAMSCGYAVDTVSADNVYPANTQSRVIRSGQRTGQYVVREVQLHQANSRRGITVVHRSYVDRIVTKAKAHRVKRESNVVHVRTYGTNIFLRTDRDYHRQNGKFHADSKGHLPIAKSIGKHMKDGKATIVWGRAELAPMREVSHIVPQMILERPDGAKPVPQIPNVPKPPKKDTAPLVASAR
jgi:hypothetical protein